LIKEYGKDSFEYKVRKLFATKEECLKWESKFLMKINAAKNPEWINRHNGGKNFYNNGGYKLPEFSRQKLMGNQRAKGNILSIETRNKMKISHKNRIITNEFKLAVKNGINKLEILEKIRNSHLGKSLSDNHKQKIKEGLNNSEAVKTLCKNWKITTPDNKELIIFNLTKFCKDNNLNQAAMWRVANKKVNHHKNFKCEYFYE
jgi:hypothetical protein